MADDKEVVSIVPWRDAFQEDGVELDRTTGQRIHIEPSNTFDPDTKRFDGKLDDLTTVKDEDGNTRLIAKQNLAKYQQEDGTEVAKGTKAAEATEVVESEDRGSPYELIPPWEDMNEYGQELLEPAEADQIRTEQEMLHKMVGPRDAAQTVSIIDGMTQGASEAVLLVIGEGNDDGMSGPEAIAKIEGALDGEDLQSFRNGLTQFPQSLKDLLEI